MFSFCLKWNEIDIYVSWSLGESLGILSFTLYLTFKAALYKLMYLNVNIINFDNETIQVYFVKWRDDIIKYLMGI